MQALADRKDLRADILVPTTGLKRRIAVKKSWQSAADDIQTAIDESETDAQTLVTAFHPDDRVRYLDGTKLWSFLVEGEFWTSTAKGPTIAVARKHVAYLIDRALADKLITARDVVDGISVAQMTSHLPRGELAKIIGAALEAGRAKASFTDVELLAALPPSVLVEHVPLTQIFESVVHTKVAMVHDYIAKPKAGQPEKEPEKEPEKATGAQSTPPPGKERRTKPPSARGSKRPPPPDGAGTEATSQTTDESEWVEIPESVR